jgi:hypothetical protein
MDAALGECLEHSNLDGAEAPSAREHEGSGHDRRLRPVLAQEGMAIGEAPGAPVHHTNKLFLNDIIHDFRSGNFFCQLVYILEIAPQDRGRAVLDLPMAWFRHLPGPL